METAEKIGARHFNIPPAIWEKLSSAEQWAANQKFLDRAIARGDEIILSNPFPPSKAGTALQKEVEYLLEKGYELVDDGMRLIRGN